MPDDVWVHILCYACLRDVVHGVRPTSLCLRSVCDSAEEAWKCLWVSCLFDPPGHISSYVDPLTTSLCDQFKERYRVRAEVRGVVRNLARKYPKGFKGPPTPSLIAFRGRRPVRYPIELWELLIQVSSLNVIAHWDQDRGIPKRMFCIGDDEEKDGRDDKNGGLCNFMILGVLESFGMYITLADLGGMVSGVPGELFVLYFYGSRYCYDKFITLDDNELKNILQQRPLRKQLSGLEFTIHFKTTPKQLSCL